MVIDSPKRKRFPAVSVLNLRPCLVMDMDDLRVGFVDEPSASGLRSLTTKTETVRLAAGALPPQPESPQEARAKQALARYCSGHFFSVACCRLSAPALPSPRAACAPIRQILLTSACNRPSSPLP